MPDPRHRLGLEVEAAVADRLGRSGWRILERRCRTAAGELDLVCLDPAGVLVAVEVRARRSPRSGSAAESGSVAKVARLRRALRAYAAGTGRRSVTLRVDLVTVDRDAQGRWRMARHPAIDGW